MMKLLITNIFLNSSKVVNSVNLLNYDKKKYKKILFLFPLHKFLCYNECIKWRADVHFHVFVYANTIEVSHRNLMQYPPPFQLTQYSAYLFNWTKPRCCKMVNGVTNWISCKIAHFVLNCLCIGFCVLNTAYSTLSNDKLRV